jgi:DNA-binding Lrp family transcriptional regulator
MTLGLENKAIADELRIPLSCIQRRVRHLLRSGYVSHIFQLNYKKLGLKKGLLHIYLRTGDMMKVAEDLLSIDGIMSAGIHVGNSDIVAEFVYEDTEQLVDLISHVKEMAEVDSVLWSEEVYLLTGKGESRSSVLKRLINRKVS